MDEPTPDPPHFNFQLFSAYVIVVSIITAISAFFGVVSVGVLLTNLEPSSSDSEPAYEFLSNEKSARIGLEVGLVSSIVGMLLMSISGADMYSSRFGMLLIRSMRVATKGMNISIGVIGGLGLAISGLVPYIFLLQYSEVIQNNDAGYTAPFFEFRFLYSGLIPLGVGVLIALWQYFRRPSATQSAEEQP